MPDILIKPRADKPTTNDCIQLAVELGEFRAISGCGFDVAWTGDSMTLKITYWQDETFTALRLKFGHMFVTPELKKIPVPVTRPARTLPRPTRADDSEAWTWQEMVRIAGERQPSKKVSHSEEESAAERVRRRIAQRYMGGLVREHIEQDEDPKRRSLRG